MFVTTLEVHQFRSYEHAIVPLEAGVNVFVGRNGQGKTNLVEAVDYFARLGSHRVASDAPLIRAGAGSGLLRAKVQAGTDDARQLLVEVELVAGRANRARLNKSPLPRPREILGIVRTVVFSPEDLAIVKGDPSVRRRFIDDLLVQRWPRFAAVRQDYERVLKQRNALLKQLSTGRSDPDGDSTLDVWDEQLITTGVALMEARCDTLTALQGPIATAYAQISGEHTVAQTTYQPSLSTPVDNFEHNFRSALAAKRREERLRGITLVGPHRDDVDLMLGNLPAKGYASHGECWSFALALRLASFELLRGDGIEPILILDDVFAELDSGRRACLVQEATKAEQVLITAAVGADVPDELGGRRYTVQEGTVSVDD